MAKTVLKSKWLELGAPIDFKMRFRQAHGFRWVAQPAAGAGVCEGWKDIGRRGTFEECRHRCYLHGKLRVFVLGGVDVSIHRFRVQGCKMYVTEGLLCKDHFARQWGESVWQAQCF